MAVRVENTNNIDFGDAAATVTITHGEALYGASGSEVSLGIRALSATIVVTAGQPMQIDAGEFDLLLPSGDVADAAWKKIIDKAVKATDEGWLFKAYTSATAEVTDTGYSAQRVAGTAITTTTEDDS